MVSGSRILHTMVLLRAVTALQQAAFEVHPVFAILGLPCALVTDGVTCGADTGQIDRIELEFTGRDGLLPASIRQVLMPLAVLVFLVLEFRIPAAKPVVRNIPVYLSLMQILYVSFVGEAGVGSNNSALLINTVGSTQFLEAGFDRFQYRLQGMVFLAFAESLRIDDDLVLLIHRGHAVIALDRAHAGGHLGTFVVN